MTTIHKYKLEPNFGTLQMPQGAQVLTLQVQDGTPREHSV